jgi:hypothetical protein
MGLTLLAKIAVAVGLVTPLGFVMGLPFPLGLGRLSDRAPTLVPWAWGINGCASVVAAVLASLLAMHVGFTVVLTLALALYAATPRLLDGARPPREWAWGRQRTSCQRRSGIGVPGRESTSTTPVHASGMVRLTSASSYAS